MAVQSPRPRIAGADVEAVLVAPETGERARVFVALLYSSADPYAVWLLVDVGLAEPVTWMFGRDLLRDGLSEPSGTGDVRVWPGDEAAVALRLATPSWAPVFELPALRVREFLDESYRLVPEGAESSAVGEETDTLLVLGGPLDGGGA